MNICKLKAQNERRRVVYDKLYGLYGDTFFYWRIKGRKHVPDDWKDFIVIVSFRDGSYKRVLFFNYKGVISTKEVKP